MSAVPTEIALEKQRTATRARPPLAAAAYYLLVAGVAIAAAAPFVGQLAHEHDGWVALARLRRVRGGRAAVRRRDPAPRTER